MMTRLFFFLLLSTPCLFAGEEASFTAADLIKPPKYLNQAVHKMDHTLTHVTIQVKAPTGEVAFPAHDWSDTFSTTRVTKVNNGEPVAVERFYNAALTFEWSDSVWRSPLHRKKILFEKGEKGWSWKAFDEAGAPVTLELESKDEAKLLNEIDMQAAEYELYAKTLPQTGIIIGKEYEASTESLTKVLGGFFGGDGMTLDTQASKGLISLDDAAKARNRFNHQFEVQGQLVMNGTKLDLVLATEGSDEIATDQFLILKSQTNGGFRFHAADGAPVKGEGTIQSEVVRSVVAWDQAVKAPGLGAKKVAYLYNQLNLDKQLQAITANIEQTRQRLTGQLPPEQIEAFIAKANEALATPLLQASAKDYLAVGLDADRVARLETLMAKPYMKQWMAIEKKRNGLEEDPEFLKFAGALKTDDPQLNERFVRIGMLMQITGDMSRLEMTLPGTLTVSFKALGQATGNKELLNALNQYVVQTHTQQWDNVLGGVVIVLQYLLQDMSDADLDQWIKALEKDPDTSLFVETYTKALYAALADASTRLDQ